MTLPQLVRYLTPLLLLIELPPAAMLKSPVAIPHAPPGKFTVIICTCSIKAKALSRVDGLCEPALGKEIYLRVGTLPNSPWSDVPGDTLWMTVRTCLPTLLIAASTNENL